jgi:hypothetical protein
MHDVVPVLCMYLKTALWVNSLPSINFVPLKQPQGICIVRRGTCKCKMYVQARHVLNVSLAANKAHDIVFMLKLEPPFSARDYTCTVYGTIDQILKALGCVFNTG